MSSPSAMLPACSTASPAELLALSQRPLFSVKKVVNHSVNRVWFLSCTTLHSKVTLLKSCSALTNCKGAERLRASLPKVPTVDFASFHVKSKRQQAFPLSGLLAPDLKCCTSSRCIAASAADPSTSVQVTKMAEEEVVPGVIIGAGRVGLALGRMSGDKDFVVKRGETVPADSTGPIYVCTRNDALQGVVESTPADRRPDLVFIQNGMIEDWLASKGLGDATQLLVYFAVAKAGQDPMDGKTDVNPEGLTAVTGKWAEAVAKRLHSAGLACKVLPKVEFRKSMLEKLIWISAFMLVGVRHPGATCGDVEKQHKDEVVSLIRELTAAAEVEKGVKFDAGVEDRLCAYARSVADYPTAVKELEWRNGWFYGISKRALEQGKPDPCPLHTQWLKEVGAV